jgi:fatty-acid desaturase
MRSPHGPTDQSVAVDDDDADDIVYPATVPFLLVHLACFAAIWTGLSAAALVLCVALYALRMFAIGAGYHRYFAHRAYKTSRVVQFLLAFLAQTSAQRGALWWAAKHRRHHRHSDTALDVHSPREHRRPARAAGGAGDGRRGGPARVILGVRSGQKGRHR